QPATNNRRTDRRSVTVTEDATLKLTVSAAAPLGKTLAYQWKKGATNLTDGPDGPVQVIAGATNATLSIAHADLTAAGTYTCEVSLPGLTPLTSGTFTVTVTPETVLPPAPKITAPASGASFTLTTGGTVTVSGTATDNHAVGRVRIALNGGAPVDAALTSPGSLSTGFSLAVTPVPGTNTVTVQTLDANGNASPVATRLFASIVVRSISVLVSPVASGTVSLPVGAGAFQVGFRYTIKATPGTGQVFDGWTVNDATGTGITAAMQELPSLTFTHQEGLVLTANFIANPFTAAIIGKFNGLVQPSTSVPSGGTTASNETVGMLSNVVVQSNGSFTGALKIDGLSLTVAGIFDNTGVARFDPARAKSVTLARPYKAGLEVALSLDMTGTTSKLTGTVVQRLRGAVVAQSDIDADCAHYSSTSKAPAALGGTTSRTWTMVFKHQAPPSGWTTADVPQGDGYATGTVKADGTLSFTGKLADHSVITASAALSKTNAWPLYAALYGNKGSFSTQVTHTATTANDGELQGSQVQWFRPYQTVQWYPWGWPDGIGADLIGASYQIPTQVLWSGLNATNPVYGNVAVTFKAGLLGANVNKTANFFAATAAKVPTTDTTWSFTLMPSTGVMTGTFPHSNATKPSWQGVLIQRGVNMGGYGYFMTTTPRVIDGTGESGRVEMKAK
ncbi:MAG: Ig-like domain-containing protein, partial [Roseimicrobium sp.]